MGKQTVCIPTRVVVVFCAFLAGMNLYLMRMNMSEAIVAMVTPSNHINSTTPINYDTGCPAPSNHSDKLQTPQPYIISDFEKVGVAPTFDWNADVQGLILSAFFYGYLFLQYPGGALADKYGGKSVLGWSIFVSSIITLLTPLAAEQHYLVLFALRFLQGFVSGCAFPSMQSMMTRWIPRQEMGIAYTICGSTGTYLGSLLGSLITGIISDSPSLGGWPTTFYVFGLSGLIWCALWMICVTNDPQDHKNISKEELEYILSSRAYQHCEKQVDIPWKRVITSAPLLAAYAMQWGHAIVTYVIMIEMPLYMKDILKVSLTQNGIINAMPNVISIIVSILSGLMADSILRNNLMSTTNTRKAFSFIAAISASIVMCLMTIWPCNTTVFMILLWTAAGLSSLSCPGVYLCFMGMAPQFTGALYGIGNCLAATAGFSVPQLVGLVTTGAANTVHTWSLIFYVSQSITLMTAVIFLLWGSADLQPWASPKEDRRILVS